jgi:hypothetical protein
MIQEVNGEAVGRLFAIVMSAPIVVYGQGVWIVSTVMGSGSKDTSKGNVRRSSQRSDWLTGRR